jgi:hypothetical protein
MAELRKYRRRENTLVAAVQVDLDTAGFTYTKWGGSQRCQAGDWLVRNGDETYTVDGETFARTYAPVSLGVFAKQSEVWAERAGNGGAIATHEGRTEYAAGDYLVFESPRREGGYAVTAARFEQLYEPADRTTGPEKSPP